MKQSIRDMKIWKQLTEIDYNNTNEIRKLMRKLDYNNNSEALAEIAISYITDGRYKMADKFITKAYYLDRNSPGVLWGMGIFWDYYKVEEVAIECFKEIIRIGPLRGIKLGADLNLHISLSRINDSKLQLYRLLKNEKHTVAKRYFRMYEKGLEQGLFTIMDHYYETEKKNFK